MKFVCRRCEAFMRFDEVEGVREDCLGVTFNCPGCGARVSMVTNAGETQLVRSLGVRLGGRVAAPAPLELTRSNLARETDPPGKRSGKCPFAAAASQAGAAARPAGAPAPGPAPLWTPDAQERLARVPDSVRPLVKAMIEDLARRDGSGLVDGALMDAAKERFM